MAGLAGAMMSMARGAHAGDPALPVEVLGYVQADWTAFRQTSQNEVDPDGEPLNEERFVIPRARFRMTADRGYTAGALEIDANTVHGPQVRPIDAEASLKWPAARPTFDPAREQRGLPQETWFMVTFGLLPTPFGFEPTEVALRRPFLEQSTMSNAFFPGQYDLGFRVVGAFKMINYALGIMNGDPIGERTFPGRDPNQSKDLVFRVGASGDVSGRLRVEGGFSGLTGRGFHEGRNATGDQVQWRDVNEDGVVDPIELQGIPGTAAEPSATFKRFALGADVRVFVAVPPLGELALRAEVVRAANLDRGLYVADPVASSRDLRETGWYVGGTQELTRWAQIGIRYDTYNPDSDATERLPFTLVPADLSLSTWSFMATARLAHGRVVAQFDHRTNALGRDERGSPTTLADDSFTLRAEARF
ncbi:MAG: phosphate-selective porin [Labilithrix sp.]|nr:phosphate-selective porin [Labilithrix sp.]